MSTGLQELVALGLVVVIVGFALYRRWRRRTPAAPACGGCDAKTADTTEAAVRFYRREE